MTERDTASQLRAALQRRAEYGMQTTNTERELQRLRGQMTPVRRRRQFRVALATAAALAVIGGGLGLGLALSSDDHNNARPISPRPTPTTLPAGELPTGFPLGTYQHPGSTGLTKLRITRGAAAFVSSPDGSARNVLAFTTPDIVTFDTLGLAGCSKPGLYRWAVANDELVLTALDDGCSERRIALTEKPWGPVKRTATAAPSAATAFTSAISPLVGLHLTWPTTGWHVVDSAAEVTVRPPDLRGASLHIAKGLFPQGPDGGFLTTRPSPTSVIAALRQMPALEVSKPVREHLGEGIAVVHVDMRLSPSAPRSGFIYMDYKGNSVNGGAFTITRGTSVRLYIGVYRAPYGRELLNIAVEAPTGKVFSQWTTLAARALETIRLPKGFVPARAYAEWGS